MAGSGLIDTGVILALLDRRDAWHLACKEAYDASDLPLLTTEAVLTEAFHLVERTSSDFESIWLLLASGAIRMAPIQDGELSQIHLLMTKYQDRPMDFADATLVHVAERESLSVILTVDHDDFETYRIGGNKKFTILPERRSN